MEEMARKKLALERRLSLLVAREASVQQMSASLDEKLSSVADDLSELTDVPLDVIEARDAYTLAFDSSDTCRKVFRGHTASLLAITFDTPYGTLVSGSADGTARVWDITTTLCSAVLQGHLGWVRAVQIERERIVTASGDATMRQWRAATGDCEGVLRGHTAGITAMQMARDRIISGSADRSVRVWDADSGTGLQVLVGHTSYISALQFWDCALVTASGDHNIRMWDLRTGKSHRTLHGHTSAVTCVQFDEDEIISGSSDGTLRFWDIRKAALRTTMEVGDQVNAIQCSGDSVTCAVVGRPIQVLDRQSLECVASLDGHAGEVRCLQRMDCALFSGGVDRTVRLWRLQDVNTV